MSGTYAINKSDIALTMSKGLTKLTIIPQLILTIVALAGKLSATKLAIVNLVFMAPLLLTLPCRFFTSIEDKKKIAAIVFSIMGVLINLLVLKGIIPGRILAPIYLVGILGALATEGKQSYLS